MEVNKFVGFARRHYIPSFFIRRPLFSLAAVATPAVAVIGGMKQYQVDQDNPELSSEERFERAVFRGSESAASALALGGAATLAYNNREAIMGAGSYASKTTGSWVARQATRAFSGAEETRKLLRASGAGAMASAIRSYGGNARIMTGAGAVFGGIIGSRYDHPIEGAAIGAGVGLAVKAGLGVNQLWKTVGKVPGGRMGLMLAASTVLYGGVRATMSPQVQSEAYASDDGSGGYDYSDRSSVSRRMNRINATGNVALGLHNKRHG
jgi:hypothetical protein